MKPFPNRTSTFQRIRLSPDSTRYGEGIRAFVMARSHDRLVRSGRACSPSLSAGALRPATALPVTLGGRDSTDYYGLSAPLLVLAISRPTLLGTSKRFRRCSCRNYCAAVGALSTPSRGVPRVGLASWDVRPVGLPLYGSRTPVAGQEEITSPSCFVPSPPSHRR